MKYNRQLMQAIMWDRINIAEVVGVQVINLDQAPEGYGEFDAGVPKKFVIDPHKMWGRRNNRRLTRAPRIEGLFHGSPCQLFGLALWCLRTPSINDERLDALGAWLEMMLARGALGS